jgi:GNAT superfamily N-acetyltransferase
MLEWHEPVTPEIIVAMERNMVAHMAYAPALLSEAMVLTDNGVTRIDSGFRTDTFNVACGANLPPESADATIHAVIAWFRDRDQPFSWWVGPASRPLDLAERLSSSGLAHVEDEAGMICHLTALALPAGPPAGISVRRVTTLPELLDVAAVVAANWEPPDQDVVAYYQRVAPFVLSPASPHRYWTAYDGNAPVASCELFLDHGVAGLYAVVTRASHRRRGIGTHLTAVALSHARSEGFHIGTLQASGQGQRIYERLGFVPCGLFREFKPPPRS